MVIPGWAVPVMAVIVVLVGLLTIARFAFARGPAAGPLNVIYLLVVGTLVAGLAIGGMMYMKKMQKDAISDKP